LQGELPLTLQRRPTCLPAGTHRWDHAEIQSLWCEACGYWRSPLYQRNLRRLLRPELAQTAAKAALELDGYKRVTVLGRGSNGAWRAKGYRGTTEVLLTVDDTGRVSTE